MYFKADKFSIFLLEKPQLKTMLISLLSLLVLLYSTLAFSSDYVTPEHFQKPATGEVSSSKNKDDDRMININHKIWVNAKPEEAKKEEVKQEKIESEKAEDDPKITPAEAVIRNKAAEKYVVPKHLESKFESKEKEITRSHKKLSAELVQKLNNVRKIDRDIVLENAKSSSLWQKNIDDAKRESKKLDEQDLDSRDLDEKNEADNSNTKNAISLEGTMVGGAINIIEDEIGDLIDNIGVLDLFRGKSEQETRDIDIGELPEVKKIYDDNPQYKGFDLFVPKSKPKSKSLVKEDKSLPTILDTKVKSLKKITFKPKAPKYEESKSKSRRLKMHNLHTSERIDVTYYKNGRYVDSALRQINRFFRDHRQNESIAMDIDLINLLHKVVAKLRYRGEIKVVSGYRSTKTQRKFRRQGRNVARKSQHSLGKAIDFKLPGVSTRRVRNIAKQMKMGGVGFYPKDGFIHIDTGDVRYW